MTEHWEYNTGDPPEIYNCRVCGKVHDLTELCATEHRCEFYLIPLHDIGICHARCAFPNCDKEVDREEIEYRLNATEVLSAEDAKLIESWLFLYSQGTENKVVKRLVDVAGEYARILSEDVGHMSEDNGQEVAC